PHRLSSLCDGVCACDELNPRDQVNEQISCKALAIVGEAAPAKEPRRIKRPLRRVAEESVPVDGLLAGVGRNWINPRAARGITIPVGIDVENVAQFSGVVDFLCFRVEDGADALAADLRDAVSFARRFHHGETVFDGMRHRLLTVDVLASCTSIFEYFAMLMIRDCDDECVDIFSIQNLFVVARGGGLRFFDRLAGGGVSPIVEIANSNALDSRDPQGSLQ